MVADAFLTAEAWEWRYRSGMARWNTGSPAPPFIHFLKSNQALKPGSMAVLGCGTGEDALLFSRHGFAVTGFDFASTAIASASDAANTQGLSAQFLERDIFQLASSFYGQFDYVLEHGCFCAIAPHLRPNYVKVVHALLKQEGILIGLFLTHAAERNGRPPFAADEAKINALFAVDFEILSFQPSIHSSDDRQNQEVFVQFQVKGNQHGTARATSYWRE